MNFLRLVMLATAACLLCASCQEKEIKRRTVGYKGKAKSNPFLAAERFLAKEGAEASSEHGLGRLDESTAVLFLPPSSVNTVGRGKRLLQWASGGGHLVLMLEGGEMGGNDFTMHPVSSRWLREPENGLDYLLDKIGVKYAPQELEGKVGDTPMTLDQWEAMEEKERALLGSEKYTVNLGHGALELRRWEPETLGYRARYPGDYGSRENGVGSGEHRFVSIKHGSGRVSVLADARPLRNRYLGYADHAGFLAGLVELSRPGKVVFSSGEGDGFFSMLWRHFRLGVIGLLLLVVFWLWRHLPRFGPEQDIGGGGTREFSEQLRGTGRFLWRHQRDDALLGALRANVHRRLSLRPGMSREGVFEQLAATSGLPQESVVEAMTRERITEPGAMVRVTSNLQKILKHIH